MENAVAKTTGQQQITASTPAAICVDDQYTATTSSLEQQQQIASTPDAVMSAPNAGQQQQNLKVPVISLEDRKLLDAKVSSKPVNSLNPTGFSTGRVSKSRNKMQGIQQQ